MEHHGEIGNGTGAPLSGGGGQPNPRGGAPDAADRLTMLTHELRNLLDGSLRWIAIMARDLPRGSGSGHDPVLFADLEKTRTRLEMIRLALVQMNDLVQTSMKGGLSLGSPLLSPSERISLGEALDHAADVVRPRSASLGIGVSVEIDPRAGPRAAGPMYTVMLNGLHNAIDSIERRLAGTPGSGHISARLGWSERAGVNRAVLEITDDGAGPPELEDPGGIFEPAFSTKPGGTGIGLALSQQIVMELGGRIELLPRSGGGGAVLRVIFPAPEAREIRDA